MDTENPPVTTDTHNYVKWFRHSSPYINAHRGKTFVLMLPGAAMEHANFPNIIHDITLLNSLGVRLVLVQGARPQIDARLADAGVESVLHEGTRITDQATLRYVAQAVGETRLQVEAMLSTGLPNSPMHGAHIRVVGGNFVMAKPWGVVDGVDLQHTGKVRRVDTRALALALDSNAIVLMTPMGFSPTGEIFNLSFADVATHVAIALKADKLIAFTSEDGFTDSSGELKRQLSLHECAQELAKLRADNDRSQSLQACYDACQEGVTRAQMVSYIKDGALLQELFTRDGSGTMVYRDSYESVRQANIDDVGGIIELIRPMEEKGILVRRSRELLETEIGRFTVLEKDGTIIACAALYPYSDSMAELACVATHQEYQRGGRAATVLQAIEERARAQGFQKLFVLTTQTSHWFQEHGFVPGDLTGLPKERQSLYNFQRNSKIFFKPL